MSDVLEIDTADPAEWPADPEEWPHYIKVQDIDSDSEAVYTRLTISEEDDDE